MNAWRFVARYAAIRFVVVIFLAVAMTFLALLSGALPTPVFFDVLAWPVAGMLRLFPPPCWDRGPGNPPFCEGTPIQILAAGFGLIVTFVFYCLIASWLLKRYLKRRFS